MANVTQTLACTGSARVDIWNENRNEHGASSYDALITVSRAPNLLLQFAQIGSSYLYKKLVSYQLKIFYTTNYSGVRVTAFPLGATFNPATVTEKTTPSGYSIYGGHSSAPKTGSNVVITSDPDYADSAEAADFVTKYLGFKLWATGGGSLDDPPDSANFTVYTESASADKRPQLLITVDNAVTVTSQVTGTSGTAGYLDPTEALTFTWDFQINGPNYCAGRWTQASATFKWSSDNGSTWNSVAASGSTQSVTLPANTLPRGTILWKVTATDNQGTTTTSSTYTITTADQLITTTPISPSNTIEDGDSEIVFTWSINSPSGTLPQLSHLKYKYPGDVSFTDINVPGPATSYAVPGGTFSSGTVIWGVNVQNQAGNWSTGNPVTQFVCVAAPAAPVVNCDGKPFATIEWQATGQQAWRLTVDGEKTCGPYFGATKSFALPDYLEDGEHTVAVEVQGQYGLWSQPGTVTFTVSNVPGDAVTLKALCYRDAELSWTSDSTTADWLIYRDGVRIGHTPYAVFTDRRSIGRHSWQVINRLAGGYYTASNVVQDELRSCTPAAVPLEGGEWLELRKSDAQTREDIWQGSQTAAIRHFAGEEYPTAEFAAFKDETVSLSVAWMPEEAEEARRFENLIGQPVIYKNKDRMLVGVLQAFNLRRPQFYRAYSITLTRIHWRDYVDEDA